MAFSGPAPSPGRALPDTWTVVRQTSNGGRRPTRALGSRDRHFGLTPRSFWIHCTTLGRSLEFAHPDEAGGHRRFPSISLNPLKSQSSLEWHGYCTRSIDLCRLAAGTGSIGVGKVFVFDLGHAGIRTGHTGDAAL